jgi:hypothetical protein
MGIRRVAGLTWNRLLVTVDNNIIMLKRKSHWNQSSFILKQVEEEKTTQAVKITPHINLGKGATLVLSTVKLLHRKYKLPIKCLNFVGSLCTDWRDKSHVWNTKYHLVQSVTFFDGQATKGTFTAVAYLARPPQFAVLKSSATEIIWRTSRS